MGRWRAETDRPHSERQAEKMPFIHTEKLKAHVSDFQKEPPAGVKK